MGVRNWGDGFEEGWIKGYERGVHSMRWRLRAVAMLGGFCLLLAAWSLL